MKRRDFLKSMAVLPMAISAIPLHETPQEEPARQGTIRLPESGWSAEILTMLGGEPISPTVVFRVIHERGRAGPVSLEKQEVVIEFFGSDSIYAMNAFINSYIVREGGIADITIYPIGTITFT